MADERGREAWQGNVAGSVKGGRDRKRDGGAWQGYVACIYCIEGERGIACHPDLHAISMVGVLVRYS